MNKLTEILIAIVAMMSLCGCSAFVESPAKQHQLILTIDQDLLQPLPPMLTIEQYKQSMSTESQLVEDK